MDHESIQKSPFHMPARLADGLGHGSDLDAGSIRFLRPILIFRTWFPRTRLRTSRV